MYQHFQILGEKVRQYRRFNAVGTQITVRLNHPPDTEPDSVDYFLASVDELFEYALANIGDGDMVGIIRPLELAFVEKTRYLGT
jgi:hypothetical protein